MDNFDIVADSEGEGLVFSPAKARGALSSIETAESDSGLRRVSSIVTSSVDPSLTTKTTTTKPHGHQEQNTATISDMDFPDALSIADRAKMRQRPSTRVLHPFDDDNEDNHAASFYDPKPRPKPRPKRKKLIEDNSDFLSRTKDGDDPSVFPQMQSPPMPELTQSPPPPPRMRPKPRPIKRGQKAGVEAGASSSDKPTENKQPASQPSIPVPTSSLPPSDPPAPTSTGQYTDVVNAHTGSMPPIVTLAHPASSPSSLFSAVDKDNAHMPDLEDDPLLLGPPSTFFTGSSSPEQAALPPHPANSNTRASKEIEIIDLCTIPPRATDVQVKKANRKKGIPIEKNDQNLDKGKAKAMGKRKARDEDELWLASGDDDDAYDDGEKRKKAKAKVTSEKGKEKTGKKAATLTKKIPEIVIDTLPPKSVTKSKRKEKDGLRVALGPEDDLIREDDMVDRVDHPPTIKNSYQLLRTPPQPARPVNHSREPGTPLSPVPDSEGEEVLDASVAGSVKTTTVLASSRNRKRRNGVIYDEEDEAWEKEEEEGSSPKKKVRTKSGTRVNGKKRVNAEVKQKKQARGVESKSEEDEFCETVSCRTPMVTLLSDEVENIRGESVKENMQSHNNGFAEGTFSSNYKPKPPSLKASPATNNTNNAATIKPAPTGLTSGYIITPRTKSIPMSELIKRVNSLPHSPSYSPTPYHRGKSTAAHPGVRLTSVTAYSPYLKTSRSFLSRIAPLHPNRRTPPPPPPPPPPRKKSKKEIEREEQWEEELIESVGGPAAWSCLPEEERKGMRRAKCALERGEVDD